MFEIRKSDMVRRFARRQKSKGEDEKRVKMHQSKCKDPCLASLRRIIPTRKGRAARCLCFATAPATSRAARVVAAAAKRASALRCNSADWINSGGAVVISGAGVIKFWPHAADYSSFSIFLIWCGWGAWRRERGRAAKNGAQEKDTKWARRLLSFCPFVRRLAGRRNFCDKSNLVKQLMWFPCKLDHVVKK